MTAQRQVRFRGHQRTPPRSRVSTSALIFLCALTPTLVLGLAARVAAQEPPSPPHGAAPPAYVEQSPEQLQQLVAPIALYPDSLVAQVLAAATFPEQVVEADRWLQANPGLRGAALAQSANAQPWDDSVKALTAFADVLGNMDKNLSWTSSLGDAYYNQPQDVMAAVQVMRQRATAAGNLETTPQQLVTTQDANISVEPANPEVVYVPAYDPWVVYGAPIYPWPGWYPYPGIWYAGPVVSFSIGFPIAFFGGFAWGWHGWGFDWLQRYPVHGHRPWHSSSTTFYNRGSYYGPARRGSPGGTHLPPVVRPGGGPPPGAGRPGEAVRPGNVGRPVGSAERPFNSPGVAPRPFNGSIPAARGYAAPQGESGIHSGAFSGYNRGGDTRGFSSRGNASFGGSSPHSGGGAAPGGGSRGGRSR